MFPNWHSIIIDVDKCEFMQSVAHREHSNTISPTAGVRRHFDKHRDDVPINQCQFVLTESINGQNYNFISPIFNRDISSLKMDLVFNKRRLLFNPDNPGEYFFEMN
jgi:hypothetical protein